MTQRARAKRLLAALNLVQICPCAIQPCASKAPHINARTFNVVPRVFRRSSTMAMGIRPQQRPRRAFLRQGPTGASIQPISSMHGIWRRRCPPHMCSPSSVISRICLIFLIFVSILSQLYPLTTVAVRLKSRYFRGAMMVTGYGADLTCPRKSPTHSRRCK